MLYSEGGVQVGGASCCARAAPMSPERTDPPACATRCDIGAAPMTLGLPCNGIARKVQHEARPLWPDTLSEALQTKDQRRRWCCHGCGPSQVQSGSTRRLVLCFVCPRTRRVFRHRPGPPFIVCPLLRHGLLPESSMYCRHLDWLRVKKLEPELAGCADTAWTRWFCSRASRKGAAFGRYGHGIHGALLPVS